MATEHSTGNDAVGVAALESRKAVRYNRSGNLLVDDGLECSLLNIRVFAAFLADYYMQDATDHADKNVQHGRAIAARMLADALEKVHEIESGSEG